jgi:hypothetical protein
MIIREEIIEARIKEKFREEFQNDEGLVYSDKSMETFWNIWWGIMDTNMKNALIKAINEIVDDVTLPYRE